jgi:vancomycin resistance protein YoaR
MLKRNLLITTLGLLVVAVIIPISYQLAYWGEIYPGVMIQEIDLGNLDPEKAQKKLTAKIAQQAPQEITINFDNGYQVWQWTITGQEINQQFNFAESIRAAYQIGRQGNLKQRVEEKLLAWQGKTSLPLQQSFRQEVIDEKIALITQALELPDQPTQVIYRGTSITIIPGQEGLSVDQRKLKEMVISRFSYLDDRPISVPTRPVNPLPDQDMIEGLQQRAKIIVGKTITLKLNEETFTIPDTTLISFLHYNAAASRNNITKWVTDFAQEVNRPPLDALFEFKNNSLSTIQESQSGYQVEEEALTILLEEGIERLIDEPETNQTYQLPITIEPAQTTTEKADSLGIKEKIGQGESYYRGSSSARVHNIKTASEKLHGQLVPPTETFSFNEAIEEISTQTGYKTGYIIKDGQTVPGIGGGVCQVSTTMFRAILNSGLPVAERQPHAYRVAVYEQESHPGLDATVFNPSPDLKFVNDTGHYILVQTRFLPLEWRLIIEFYGAYDGRQSRLTNFRLWDIAPPPPALYIDDPNLPKDEIKQIDWAAYGAKAAFDWEVARDGKILQKETFYSYYQPWQAKYLRGTRE